MKGILTKERLVEIKHEVIFMFEECEIITYPIDCFAIAKKLYYVLRPYTSLNPEEYRKALATDPDGYSTVEMNPVTGMNEYVIYYNDCAKEGRMRWTIFHEIGHIYLGHHDNLDDCQTCFLQPLITPKCRMPSKKLQWEIPHFCMCLQRSFYAGEMSLQTYFCF